MLDVLTFLDPGKVGGLDDRFGEVIFVLRLWRAFLLEIDLISVHPFCKIMVEPSRQR